MQVFHSSYSWWFHWSLNDNKSFQVSRTLLSIIAVVWKVSVHPLISFVGSWRQFQGFQLWLESLSPSFSTTFSSSLARYRLLLLFYSMWIFHTSFNWRISDNNFLPVSRTLLNILADFNSAVVWMVSILPLISLSPSLFQGL